MKSRAKNFSFFILAILFFLNIISWIIVLDLNSAQALEVNFLNVGQGDAIFMVSPQNHQILIDGGPDSTIAEKLAKEMPFWDRTIDLIILTHPERDHMVGLIEVLKRYKVENILWTGVLRDTSEYQEWLKLIEKEGAQIKIAKAGQKISIRIAQPSPTRAQRRVEKRFISLTSARGIRQLPSELYFDILFPFDDVSGQNLKNSNDTSIVTKLVFKNTAFLFTGDISSNGEEKLISANLRLESDVLKVSHHGSKYSTSENFLENVLPEIAIIQVGKNSYGHPTKEVLERLEKFGIKVLRTDLDGDIKIISDGKMLKLE